MAQQQTVKYCPQCGSTDPNVRRKVNTDINAPHDSGDYCGDSWHTPEGQYPPQQPQTVAGVLGLTPDPQTVEARAALVKAKAVVLSALAFAIVIGTVTGFFLAIYLMVK